MNSAQAVQISCTTLECAEPPASSIASPETFADVHFDMRDLMHIADDIRAIAIAQLAEVGIDVTAW